MLAALDDPNTCCIIERDDGFVDDEHPVNYLRRYNDWPEHERQAISLARGRVLDIGCGPGRVAIYLQDKGLDVIGIDNSPLALEASRRRGLKNARAISIADLGTRKDGRLGTFDTIVMYGNNFGLLGSSARARTLLRRFGRMTSLAGRIIAQTFDPYQTSMPEHLAYHRRNLRRGRLAGQARIRVRYRTRATPYLDYLFVSREEMRRIVDGTGWRIARFVDSPTAQYVAVLEKERLS